MTPIRFFKSQTHFIVRQHHGSTTEATTEATTEDKRTLKILKFCSTPRSRAEIQKYLNILNNEYFRK
jgi:hypothetical protein